MKSLALLLMFALAPKPQLAPPKAVEFEGVHFNLLTGPTLETTLVGQRLTAIRCNDTSQCTEAFYDRGRYAKSGDREVIHGEYTLGADHYCAGWDDYRFCTALYQSDDGRLATMPLKCGVRCLTLVERHNAPTDGSDWEPREPEEKRQNL